jgi:hypothetical protein
MFKNKEILDPNISAFTCPLIMHFHRRPDYAIGFFITHDMSFSSV